MISAEEARELADNTCEIQLEQIERGIKETIIMGGNCIYYRANKLREDTIQQLRFLGYKVQKHIVNGWVTDETEISWEE